MAYLYNSQNRVIPIHSPSVPTTKMLRPPLHHLLPGTPKLRSFFFHFDKLPDSIQCSKYARPGYSNQRSALSQSNLVSSQTSPRRAKEGLPKNSICRPRQSLRPTLRVFQFQRLLCPLLDSFDHHGSYHHAAKHERDGLSSEHAPMGLVYKEYLRDGHSRLGYGR